MKAVILAAGRGVRMMPLTRDTPKPLLKIKNKALLDYSLELLPAEVNEVIFIVNYLAEQVIAHVHEFYPGIRVRFLRQPECNGTAKALELAKQFLGKEKFLLIFADDLHSKEAVSELAKHALGILVQESDHPERFGVVEVREGSVVDIVEKPTAPKSNLVNVGVHLLDYRIFDYPPVKSPNGEYYLTDQILALARDHKVSAVKTDYWKSVGYPEDLA